MGANGEQTGSGFFKEIAKTVGIALPIFTIIFLLGAEYFKIKSSLETLEKNNHIYYEEKLIAVKKELEREINELEKRIEAIYPKENNDISVLLSISEFSGKYAPILSNLGYSLEFKTDISSPYFPTGENIHNGRFVLALNPELEEERIRSIIHDLYLVARIPIGYIAWIEDREMLKKHQAIIGFYGAYTTRENISKIGDGRIKLMISKRRRFIFNKDKELTSNNVGIMINGSCLTIDGRLAVDEGFRNFAFRAGIHSNSRLFLLKQEYRSNEIFCDKERRPWEVFNHILCTLDDDGRYSGVRLDNCR